MAASYRPRGVSNEPNALKTWAGVANGKSTAKARHVAFSLLDY
jgi:hypothetical protein